MKSQFHAKLFCCRPGGHLALQGHTATSLDEDFFNGNLFCCLLLRFFRWNMQQKVYLEEMQALKEMRRTERSKQSANNKKLEEALHHLDRKFIQDRCELIILTGFSGEEILFAVSYFCVTRDCQDLWSNCTSSTIGL